MNSLGKKFNFVSLIAFAIPNIIMMIFLSLYTIVDGMFISRYAGTLALSAQNMSYPITCIQMAIGIMLGTGGSAVIAKKMGENKYKEARGNFTLLVLTAFFMGVIFAAICIMFLDEILLMLGTKPEQFKLCKEYTCILVFFAPAMFLQTIFQSLFVTAGKPGLGLFITLAGGFANMIFDYIFVALFEMGMNGAAYATVISYLIPAITGIIYFSIARRKESLYFTGFKTDFKMLARACTNGSSEMVTNIANAVTTLLFNIIFMKFYGVDGVASITIVLYFQFVFAAVFFGYSMGIAPVISFKYGMQDIPQIKAVFRYSIIFILICSATAYLSSIVFIRPLLMIFTSNNMNVFNITIEGFPIYALSFAIMGIGVFASSMFTAFSNGRVSAIISFCRTFIFLAGCLVILPYIVGAIGVWIATPAAEAMGFIVALYFIIKNKKTYKY